MEVSISVERDTHNTYANDLKIHVVGGSVQITLDDNRTITVSKKELLYAINQPED